jgi:hypothetical protein
LRCGVFAARLIETNAFIVTDTVMAVPAPEQGATPNPSDRMRDERDTELRVGYESAKRRASTDMCEEVLRPDETRFN